MGMECTIQEVEKGFPQGQHYMSNHHIIKNLAIISLLKYMTRQEKWLNLAHIKKQPFENGII